MLLTSSAGGAEPYAPYAAEERGRHGRDEERLCLEQPAGDVAEVVADAAAGQRGAVFPLLWLSGQLRLE